MQISPTQFKLHDYRRYGALDTPGRFPDASLGREAEGLSPSFPSDCFKHPSLVTAKAHILFVQSLFSRESLLQQLGWAQSRGARWSPGVKGIMNGSVATRGIMQKYGAVWSVLQSHGVRRGATSTSLLAIYLLASQEAACSQSLL
jgi:hypothetical protein